MFKKKSKVQVTCQVGDELREKIYFLRQRVGLRIDHLIAEAMREFIKNG